MRGLAVLLPLTLLVGCVTFPSKLAVTQLQDAKKLSTTSNAYNGLATLAVDCPARPGKERERDFACAQLWAYKASGCLKDYQDRLDAIAGKLLPTAEERAGIADDLSCALSASASAQSFVPGLFPPNRQGDLLTILILRARAIERRRENPDVGDRTTDTFEIGAVSAQMTALPNGSYYAAYFLAGNAASHASAAGRAAQRATGAAKDANRAQACGYAQGGLQILPDVVPVPALVDPLATRRDILDRLKTGFCA